MTEAEWLACDHPRPMLTFLNNTVSDRSLRLLAVACCWRVGHLADQEGEVARLEGRALLELAERLADGEATDQECDQVPAPDYGSANHFQNAARLAALQDVRNNVEDSLDTAALVAGVAAYVAVGERNPHATDLVGEDAMMEAREKEWEEQAALIRELFGNPFRPSSVGAFLLVWSEGIIRKLAEGIHADRAFDRMPILADALEEAGCADDAILTHLRSPGPHVRGCWALDLLLGKS
jgi:hypothetical protein